MNVLTDQEIRMAKEGGEGHESDKGGEEEV
jgi:hypothetical protein